MYKKRPIRMIIVFVTIMLNISFALIGCGSKQQMNELEQCAAALEKFQKLDAYSLTYISTGTIEGKTEILDQYECLWVKGSWLQEKKLATGSSEWKMYTPESGYIKISNSDLQGDWLKYDVSDTDYGAYWLSGQIMDPKYYEMISKESDGDNTRIILEKESGLWFVYVLDGDGNLMELTLTSPDEPHTGRTYIVTSTDLDMLTEKFEAEYRQTID